MLKGRAAYWLLCDRLGSDPWSGQGRARRLWYRGSSHSSPTLLIAVLAQRYAHRGSKTKEFKRYEDVGKSKTERGVREFANVADNVVATDRCTPEAVLVGRSPCSACILGLRHL